MIKLFLLSIIGIIGGYLGRHTRIPGGSLLGAMLFTSWVNAKGIHYYNLPFFFILSLQVLAGALVGQKVTTSILKEMKEMIIPVAFLLTIIMSVVFFLMIVLHGVFGWDLVTSWLSSSPGRMQDMIVLAGTLNADGAKVATAHLVRHLTVIFLTPIILLISKKLIAKKVKRIKELQQN